MPRKPRIMSSSSIYHIILRSVNQHIIFEDDSDYQKFLFVLSDSVKRYDIQIYAYCLMDNHAHLLIHASSEPDLSDGTTINILAAGIFFRIDSTVWQSRTTELSYLFCSIFITILSTLTFVVTLLNIVGAVLMHTMEPRTLSSTCLLLTKSAVQKSLCFVILQWNKYPRIMEIYL